MTSGSVCFSLYMLVAAVRGILHAVLENYGVDTVGCSVGVAGSAAENCRVVSLDCSVGVTVSAV